MDSSNEETPGFELVENAMALVEPPSGKSSDGVTVRLVETIDDLAASDHVTVEAFEMGAEAAVEMEGDRAKRFAEYTTEGNPFAPVQRLARRRGRWYCGRGARQLRDQPFRRRRSRRRPRTGRLPCDDSCPLGPRGRAWYAGADGAGRSDVAAGSREQRLLGHRGGEDVRRRSRRVLTSLAYRSYRLR